MKIRYFFPLLEQVSSLVEEFSRKLSVTKWKPIDSISNWIHFVLCNDTGYRMMWNIYDSETLVRHTDTQTGKQSKPTNYFGCVQRNNAECSLGFVAARSNVSVVPTVRRVPLKRAKILKFKISNNCWRSILIAINKICLKNRFCTFIFLSESFTDFSPITFCVNVYFLCVCNSRYQDLRRCMWEGFAMSSKKYFSRTT